MPEAQEISTTDAGRMIAEHFAAVGEPEVAAPERPRGADGKFVSTKPKEPEEAPPEGEEAPPAEEPAPDAPEEAEQPQDEDKPEGEKPAAVLVKVKVGGKEQEFNAKETLVPVKMDGMTKEVPLDEALAGYSRTGDYTQKTQRLAVEKKEFYEKEVAPVRAERQQYAEVLDQMRQAVEALMPSAEPDWNTLKQTATPEEFTQAFAEWRGHAQRMDKIKAEQARVAALQEQDTNAQRLARLAEERQKLMDALPELKDPEKGKGLADDLTAYLVSLGFPEEGIAETEDHRLFVIAEKARRWDESQKRRPKIEEKIDRALDTIKPSSVKSAPRKSDTEAAKARLANSGRVDDAAALIAQLKL